MLCQVSAPSIKVKLRHQWDQRRGFDCSSPFPSFLWDARGSQLLHAALFGGADKSYCSKGYSLVLCICKDVSRAVHIKMHLSVCI